jgi:Asp/Glu/hydantoin racemase
MQASVAFIHTSLAAIAPLARYYAAAEPGWTITNLLDDGILRLFKRADQQAVEAALLSLIERAHLQHGAQAAMITCSAVSLELLGRLQASAPLPIVKIDVPMAQRAVRQARRIGVLVTFAPTLAPTMEMLAVTARAAARDVDLMPRLCEGAYGALLDGDTATHDRLLREGASEARAAGAEVIVLAQVSMSHLKDALAAELGVPVLSSLETSHEALREALSR